jgi:drug/metabolite transporter (DMT)-like permease
MDPIFVAAALMSAALHAGWNAAVKATANPTETMTAQMILAALVGLPLLAWTGLPAWAVAPWVAASTVFNMVAIAALLRAYETAGFGLAYPLWRASIVLAIAPLAALLAGEQLAVWAWLGIGMIAAALALLAWSARGAAGLTSKALVWIGIAAGAGAACILCEVQGVRTGGAPLAYGVIVSVTNAIVMAWRQRALGSPIAIVASCWRIALPASIASMVSYLLILWVFAHAPIAPAAALRDTSAVFAVLIAVFVLGEKLTRLQVAAVLLAAAAVPLLRVT